MAALSTMELADDELAEIDRYATEGDINLWARSTEDAFATEEAMTAEAETPARVESPPTS